MTKRALCVVLAMLSLATAHAGEFRARADVVEVEPLYRTTARAARCHYPDRPQDPDLGAALRWDLGLAPLACTSPEASRELEGYRVTYEWNGRRFTELMGENPGPSVPVRVRVH